jgi:hypothetical protein
MAQDVRSWLSAQLVDATQRARVARDPRYDGRFFTGARTTGIYCRPVCPVRTPNDSLGSESLPCFKPFSSEGRGDAMQPPSYRLSRVAFLSLGLVWGASVVQAAPMEERYTKPVKEVASVSVEVPVAGQMPALLPIFVSEDWTKPAPELRRAVLVVHGLSRNANDYFRGALSARAKAGAAGNGVLVISPQFLAVQDVEAHRLPARTLGFHWDHWAGGEAAVTPAPVSSFAAIDAVLSRLADRTLFPKLQAVVIAGFSAGGQVVQRYAVVGQGEIALGAAGIHVRYVVSDPSSYLYFSATRPAHDPACSNENAWKYGFGADTPSYVQASIADLEARYVQRDVVYLLGLADNDPNHAALDRSCAGEAQGPHRVARAMNYVAEMQRRRPADYTHELVTVPGIAHQGTRMFESPCGLALLFGADGCRLLDR